MKKLIAICLLASATSAHAVDLQIPYVPNTSGSDSIRSGNDQCSNTIDSPVKLDLGIVHSEEDDNLLNLNGRSSGNSIYARVVVPFNLFGGPKPKRVDCSRLYELQLRERELDLRERELKLRALEDLEFKK